MRTFFLSLFFMTAVLESGEDPFQPISTIPNPCPKYSLINSVDFHPTQDLFCATFTSAHRIVLYKKGKLGYHASQILKNALAHPQHAVFSRDGDVLIVANWSAQDFSLYVRDKDRFSEVPTTTIPVPEPLSSPLYRFHGIAFSPDGNFLAVAFGAGNEFDKAIAVFRFFRKDLRLELCSCLRGQKEVAGTPKGIAFSPDGKALIVTFADLNSLAIFDFSAASGQICPYPRQVVQGPSTGIFRPEDVKFSTDGTLCAISNSEADNVSFFCYNSRNNTFPSQKPLFTLREGLKFPHGLAFSADGRTLAVSQFGPVKVTDDGNIDGRGLEAQEAKITLFKR